MYPAKPIAYLACPYTHDDPVIRKIRFYAANVAASKLIERGYIVFSPISHSVPIADCMNNHNDGETWLEQDEYWLLQCDEMVVLKLLGWQESKGIKQEIETAKERNIPVKYMDGNTWEMS